MQAKKNKRRFTIQFNEIEPSHLLAIEVLNDLPSRSVARYIALAIEYYESNIKKVTKKSNTDNSVKRKRGRPPKVQSKPEETQSVLTEQSTVLEKTEEIPQRHSHIQNNQGVKKTNDTVWICLNCGHVFVGAEAPEACPVCNHPKAYFQELNEHYE